MRVPKPVSFLCVAKACLPALTFCAVALLLDACRHEPETPKEEALPAVWGAGRADWKLSPSDRKVEHVRVEKPYVAITFDDGPHPTLTPQVLDIFKKHGARATFFVLGRSATDNRSILARAAAEGHEIGVHSWSHINMCHSGDALIQSEFDRSIRVIEQATGYRPWLMRPPYGSTNPRLVNMMYTRYGMPSIIWDVDTSDWRRPGVQKVIRSAVDGAKPGSIILLHDIHPTTLAAVEEIVTGLQERGFQLVTVSQLLAQGPAGMPAVSGAGEKKKADAPAEPAGGRTFIAPSGEKEEASSVALQQQPQP